MILSKGLTMNKCMIFILLCIANMSLAAVNNKTIQFDQNIGVQLDGHYQFLDEKEKIVRTKDLLHEKPGIFVFSYSQCKTLCPLVFESLVHELGQMKKKIGADYTVIFLSIDPSDTSQDLLKRKEMVQRLYKRPSALTDWMFLRGSEKEIQKVANQFGFHYYYDPVSKQYAHPSGLIFLTPSGKVSSYLMGVNYQSLNIENALSLASKEKSGSLAEALLLYCFHYDPTNGKYGALIINAMKIAGVLTIFIFIAGFIYLHFFWRRTV